jgi:predicted alpha/beta-hydrolase family hydrolase
MRGTLSSVEPFDDDSAGPAVHGFLHRPAGPVARGLVLTHGAGSDCDAPVLVAVAEAFARGGLAVLRCDLPFRQARASGPPSPASATRDREGLRRAVTALRPFVPGPIALGGHSYGGRQASLVAADDAGLVDALLLLSYPLHPPRRPRERRVQHFPALRTPVLFVHGSRDPFGGVAELDEARRAIPGRNELFTVSGAGHDLMPAGPGLPLVEIVRAFDALRAP